MVKRNMVESITLEDSNPAVAALAEDSVARWWEEVEQIKAVHQRTCFEWQQALASRGTRMLQADSEFHRHREKIEQEYGAELQNLTAGRERAEREARKAYEDRLREAEGRRGRSRQEAETCRQNRLRALEEDVRLRSEQLQERFAHQNRELAAAHAAWLQQWQERSARLETARNQMAAQVGRWSLNAETIDFRHTIAQQAQEISWQQFDAALAAAQSKFYRLQAHPLARFLAEGWAVLVGIAFGLASLYPAVAYFGPTSLWWLVVTVGSGFGGGWLSRWLILRWMAAYASKRLPEVRADLARARWQLDQLRDHAERKLANRQADLQRWLQGEQLRLESSRQTILQEIQQRYEQELQVAEQEYHALRDDAQRQLNARLEAIRLDYEPRQQSCREQLQQRLALMQTEHAQRLRQIEERFQAAKDEIRRRWQETWQAFVHRLEQAAGMARRYYRPWQELVGAGCPLPAEIGRIVPLGWMHLQWQIDPALGTQELPNVEYPLRLPVYLQLPVRGSLLVEYDEQSRESVMLLLQSVMLRWLVAMPPGKLRFTLIDPVALGQSFAPFMHLADYDERLIHHRIWTDADHIRRRLVELTEHVETVIQKYLRNEYHSIHDYNLQAGELAEPIQLVVVADFPQGFSDESARKLASLAISGPSCGVFLLMAIDRRARLPAGLRLADFAHSSLVLQAHGGQFLCQGAPAGCRLEVDAAPASEVMNQIVRRWGQAAVGADRVEVPFSRVVPDKQQRWSQSSRAGIEVPVGQSGAHRLQWLKLGSGTSQHVVVAGKTGSGKSTLFHAVIISAALRYSPAELEFYLIDFKKGVEFKDYADYQLPHARVIAIESEREFGVSVLKKLDDELERRGRLFREAGVQEIAAFRAAQPQQILPRILVIVDEFQEFFVKEDALAREAGLLLDRLVRQGRAFGIHVVLGSQTLSGAYSLARSTLGQIAVRIALQCSETDAHLVLSEDNTAARLLARPGEAIYNDQNGMVEGNHPFQVVWLSDTERRRYLREIAEKAGVEGWELKEAVVFEGNRSPQVEACQPLLASLKGRAESLAFPTAWLGEPIAIRPPVEIEFPPASGQNLLVVGQDQQAVRELLMACLLGLAGSCRQLGRAAFIDIACGYSSYGNWSRLVGSSERVRVHRSGDVAELLQQWHEECQRRGEGRTSQEPWFCIVDPLGELPELRGEEPDAIFGRFSAEDRPLSPGARWRRLLSEGPHRGMHFLVACDGYHTFSRWCDRAVLRDFVWRVLFQMNPTDSSHFIDSPAAHQLGPNRALIYRADRGELERFRPFAGIPPWNQLLGQPE
ncbi:MAG: hypothetical protein KatS3mg110_1632 [Pirellulaceae bacterium]|nr:MAG: hypothetical protein KatS3mg110_1632 [Pirellulaceae bacterium]